VNRFIKFFLSLTIAATLLVSGNLYDVYAESEDYTVAFNEVTRTGIEPKIPIKVEDATTQQSVSTVSRSPDITTSTPSPQPVVSVANTPPAVDLSNHLEMPSIGVYRSVITVGLNSAGEIDVPSSNVGLWNGGAQPGQPGVVFLDGHLFGVFTNLKNTTVGSEFSLTWSDVVYRYRVSDNRTYSLEDLNQTSNGIWASILRTPVGGSNGLNIMTCAGQPTGNTYSHRTIVYAYQIN